MTIVVFFFCILDDSTAFYVSDEETKFFRNASCKFSKFCHRSKVILTIVMEFLILLINSGILLIMVKIWEIFYVFLLSLPKFKINHTVEITNCLTIKSIFTYHTKIIIAKLLRIKTLNYFRLSLGIYIFF